MSSLGLDGINSRIAQIQAKLDALNPPSPSLPGSKTAFGAILAPLCPSTDQLNPLTGAIGANANQYKAMADAAATKYGVDPSVFSALVKQESDWNPDAVSSVGAKGLCQLMDGTAAGLGVTDPFDPQQSLEGGAQYLRQMMDQFGGDTSKALAAYNAGPGRIHHTAAAHWPHETKGYVRNILANSGVTS